MANVGDSSVLASARLFLAINYYAFVCLTTVGFGEISPRLPLSRMVSVATSVAGPVYLAAVMGGAERPLRQQPRVQTRRQGRTRKNPVKEIVLKNSA